LFLFYQEKRKSPFGGGEPRQDSAEGKKNPNPPIGTFPLEGKGLKEKTYCTLQYANPYPPVGTTYCTL
jgi:hypothetical protein